MSAVPVWPAPPEEGAVPADDRGGRAAGWAAGPFDLPCWPDRVTPAITPAPRTTAAATAPPTIRPVFLREGRCPLTGVREHLPRSRQHLARSLRPPQPGAHRDRGPRVVREHAGWTRRN